MVCLNCGTENADGVKFCAGCGAQMAGAPEAAAPRRESRPARAPKKKMAFGMVQLLVILVTVLSLIFGICHLFVDYVVPAQSIVKENNDGDKTYEKEESYAYKSAIYKAIDEDVLGEAKEAMEELQELEEDLEVENKLTGSLSWVKLANILGGVLCILVSAIGVLYVLKDMVPVYDMAFGKIFKGRTALFVMGLGAVATSVLHLLLNALTKIRVVQVAEDVSTKTVATFGVHWTVWAFLIIGVVAVVYEMTALTRKKK